MTKYSNPEPRGIKKNHIMAVNENYLNFVLDQLSEIQNFTFKKMFGGVGFFREGKMFGAIMGGTFRLKADDQTKTDFEAHGMEAYHNKGKGKGMPYWEVPAEIMEDKDQLKVWVEKACEVALK